LNIKKPLKSYAEVENNRIQWNRAKNAIKNNKMMEILNFIQYYCGEIESEDHRGYTLLALATHYGRVKMVELFLENGANPNVFSNMENGRNTPLHMAVDFKFKKIQDLLLNAGADEKALNAKERIAWEQP
jgi:hypothetical protein